MVKKGNGRRRINQGVAQKTKTGHQHPTKNLFTKIDALISVKYREKLYKASESCFNFLGHYCCKFCFVPLSVDCDGKYVMKESLWELIFHYCLLGLLCLRILQHFVVVVIQATSGNLDLTMIFCLLSFLTHATGLGISVSLLFKPLETLQFLNTLPRILELFPQDQKTLRPLKNTMSVVIVLASITVTAFCLVLIPLLSFMVESLPVSLYHTFQMTTIPARCPHVPPVVWKLLMYPVETLVVLQSMMLAAWSCIFNVVIMNVGKSCTEHMR